MRGPRAIFLRLEQKQAVKNSSDCLLNSEGVEKTSQADLEAIFVDFLKSLFTKDILDMQFQSQLIDDLELSLNDEQRMLGKGLFTKKELFFYLGRFTNR